MKTELKPGDKVRVINTNPLKGNQNGPTFTQKEYEVKQVLTHNEHDHIDVGIESPFGSISCWETGATLPDGDKIQWCYPARFEKI